MGLLRELVLLPFAPLRGVAWTVQRVVDTAEQERLAGIRTDLAALEKALLAGEISEEDFDRREDELLDELDPGGNRMTQPGTE
ncbi:gas vesicle protein GvpG [Amycolatopsis nigrescens]|uniref:gas vesicle protein GvpG n=1 Tax=Amycolatopsis nigrescens TaxID=381445 RepID=UPI000370F7C8|nr:gas vesicle protein GvpG [Amycolatopsis nigrescens]